MEGYFLDYVRMVAVETVGQLTLEVPRHKKSLVRLLREDPSQEVRQLCDRVLKQRGWREPAWMKIQHPAWRDRVIRANANRGKGTTKGKRSEGKFGKMYWEKIKQKHFQLPDTGDLAADTPLIAGAETPRGPGATVSTFSIRPPTEEVPSSLIATISSVGRRGRDDDEQVPVPTEAVPTEVFSDLSGRRRARGEAAEEAPTSPVPSSPRSGRHEDVPVPTSPVESPDDGGLGHEEVPLPTSPAPSDDGYEGRQALPVGEDEVPPPTSPVESPHDRHGRDDQEIPLPTSPVTSPGDDDDRFAVPVSAQPASHQSDSADVTESPSEDLPVPTEARPTSEAPSFEEIEILLDEAAMQAEAAEMEEVIPLTSSLPFSSAAPRDSSTEPTSPNMVPTAVPSPTEIGDQPTIPFPTVTQQPTATGMVPEVPVLQAPTVVPDSAVYSSAAFVTSPTEMPMPTELISPTSIGDQDLEDDTSVPTVIRTASTLKGSTLPPPGERPSSPTEVMEEFDTVEAPTILRPPPPPQVPMSGSGSLITTGLQSSSVPPASPTELPVPTDLPSPTEEGDMEFQEAPTMRPMPQVQSSALITSTSGLEGSMPPASPTELPVPTDLPSPTEEGDVDYVDEATLPPPREPTEAVTSTMPSTLSRVTTVPTLTSSGTRRRQPGVAPTSPGDVPVPTQRPSPTSPGEVEEEAILGPLPQLSSGLLPGSSVPSPSEMPVPTYVPSPTDDLHLDLPTETVGVVPDPTESITSEPTRMATHSQPSVPTVPTPATLPGGARRPPTPPKPKRSRRGVPSSPADLPVPTQMPSPTSAFRDEEEAEQAELRPPPVASSGKLGSSRFSSSLPVSPSEMPVPTFVPSPTMAPEEFEEVTEIVTAPTRAATSEVATTTATAARTVTVATRRPGEAPSPVEMPVPTFVPSPSSPREELLETVAPPTAAVTSPVAGGAAEAAEVPDALPVPTEAVPSPTSVRQEPETVAAIPPRADAASSAMKSRSAASYLSSSGVVQSPSELPVPTYLPSPTSPREEPEGTATAPTMVATVPVPTASDPTLLQEHGQEVQSALASSVVLSDSGIAMSSPTELPVPTEMQQSPTSVQAEGDEPTVVPLTLTALTVPAPEEPRSTYLSDSMPIHSPEMPVPTEMPTPSMEDLKAPEPVPEPEAPVPEAAQISSQQQVSSGLMDSAPVSSPTELPVPTEMPSPTEGIEGTEEVRTQDATAAFTQEMEVETRIATETREPTEVVNTSSMEKTLSAPSRLTRSTEPSTLPSSFLDVPVPTEVVSPLAVPESALPEEEMVLPRSSAGLLESAPPASPSLPPAVNFRHI
eukprot:s1210_g7.t1